MSSKQLKQIVYVSSATHLLEEAELRHILEQSRANNRRDGITGMLLYHEGNFIQAVEGPEDVLDGLLRRIARDVRHHGIIHIYERAIEERDFADWSMGFVSSSQLDPQQVAGLNTFMDRMQRDGEEHVAPGAAHRLLVNFRDSVRR